MDDLFDDPIGDLLSDGSDDSFFDDPKLLSRKAKKVTTKTPSNVFGLDDESNKKIETEAATTELKSDSDFKLLQTGIKYFKYKYFLNNRLIF